MFDPEVLQILGLNLLAGKSPNFGENVGNAGLATLQYQRQREEDKYRREEQAFMKQQREMQIAQMKRQQQFENARDALMPQYVRPGTPDLPYNDTLGDQPPQPPIPGAPPSFDMKGYAQGLMRLGAPGIKEALALQKGSDPRILKEGDVLLDRDTNQVLARNPKSVTQFRMLTPEEAKARGLSPNQQYQLDLNTGKVAAIGSLPPSVTVNTERTFGGKVADVLAGQVGADIEAGRAAAPQVEAARRIKQLLNENQAITGTGAPYLAALHGAFAQAGLVDKSRVEATQNLISELASQTLTSIKTSGLGSGQGFTDKDRQFLQDARSGRIELQAGTIARIADLNERAALAAIRKANESIARLRQDSNFSGVNSYLQPIPVPVQSVIVTGW